MVSGSQVNADASSLSSTLNSITSSISSLSGAWKGDSFDNLNSKVSEFVSKFSGKIVEQMGKFAEACDLYKKYVELKEKLKVLKANLKTLQHNYDEAVKAGDSSAAASYSQQISETTEDIADTKQQIQDLKQQIESLLSEVVGVKLEAETKNYAASSWEKKNFMDDANFTFYDQYNGGWGQNGQYYRLGDNGEWINDDFRTSACGPTSLAMILNSMDYDVDPTTIANWCTENGMHMDSGYGTDPSFVEKYASQNSDLHCTVTGHSKEKMIDALNDGDMLVINVYSGSALSKFDHYMVVRGYDESTGQFLVADPNCGLSNGYWDADTVMGSLKNDTAGTWAIGRN